ncbi:mechanosensitive ion channel family protein [Bdellovibrio sp.]|uniref:mechanosensitive ion channel family protein n=1 Tax=Bdellovibrio TaxID=958 RepID=UPI0032216C88
MPTLFESEFSTALVNAGIATVIMIVALSLMGWLFPWLQLKVIALRDGRIRPLKFHNFEIITAQAMVSAICGLLKALRVVATLLVLYFYFSLVFSFFPETHYLSENMLQYILTPLKEVFKTILEYIPKAFYIIIIIFVMRYLLKVIRMFFQRIESGYLKIEGFHAEWAKPTYKLVRILVFAFTLIIIFPHLPGSSSPAFQGVSVFLGLLISLGSSSAISNMVAGLVITYMRPFQIGDRVKIGPTIGDVVEKNLLVTRIRTIKNVDITIPNSNILSSHIMNYSAVADSHGLILNPRITIGYDTNWRRVHQLMLDAAARTEGLMKDPKPFIFQTDLGNSYVEYELNVHTHLANKFDDVYSDLRKNLQDCFNEAKVEIMSPTYHSLRDGNEVHIPPEYKS